jgi:D-alanine-D-alanine ligase
MDPGRYTIVPLGIAPSGRWLLKGDPMAQLSAGLRDGAAGGDPASSSSGDTEAAAGDEGQGATAGRELVPGASGGCLPNLDVVFPVLHGPFGEDGTVQGLLELAGLPYVGCGVLASALAMDKIASKQVFATAGLPVSHYMALTRSQWESNSDAWIAAAEAELRYPMFVKPANLGSSIGVSKARDRRELRVALNEAAQYDRRLLVEEAVPEAREIEVAVLGNDEPLASVPGEVLPSNEFYDYAAKYIDDRSRLLIPAPLAPETSALVRQLAVRAFLAIDGAGLARVDFLLDGQTGAIFINEVNTLPGFTVISMYPKLWEASGVSYRELVDRLVELALERGVDKARSRTTYSGAMTAS